MGFHDFFGIVVPKIHSTNDEGSGRSRF